MSGITEDEVTDRLQTLCEKHGCIAGSNRIEWLDEMLSAASQMEEALRMVRDADDDCHRDGLQTIPPVPRSKIDRALASYTRDRIASENTPGRISGALPRGQSVQPGSTNLAVRKALATLDAEIANQQARRSTAEELWVEPSRSISDTIDVLCRVAGAIRSQMRGDTSQ